MKSICFVSIILLLVLSAGAQDLQHPGGHLVATYDGQTGKMIYASTGEITKDGIQLIELKNKALSDYETSHLMLPDVVATAIRNERTSLEALRNRILAQREKMMRPLPAMQEVH